MRALFCAIIFSLAACHPSYAFGICAARALHDTPSVQTEGPLLRKGDVFSAITSYTRDEADHSIGEFCSRGNYCYPTKMLIDEREVDALRLINCKIVRHGKEYDLEPIRGKVADEDIRRYYLDDRLERLGMPHIIAGAAREEYLTHPNSRCSILVRDALEGLPGSDKALTKDGNACREIVEGEPDKPSVEVASSAIMSVEQMKQQPESVRIMAMATFVRMECSSYELNDDHYRLIKQEYYPGSQSPSDSDLRGMDQMMAYFKHNKDAACQVAWNNFGPSGDTVPGLIVAR